MVLNFKAEKVECDYVFGLNKFFGIVSNINFDYGNPIFNIEYEMQFELRESGIKYIVISINKLTTTIHFIVNKNNLISTELNKFLENKFIEHKENLTLDIDISLDNPINGKKWEVDTTSLTFDDDGGLFIRAVGIDMGKMGIEVKN